MPTRRLVLAEPAPGRDAQRSDPRRPLPPGRAPPLLHREQARGRRAQHERLPRAAGLLHRLDPGGRGAPRRRLLPPRLRRPAGAAFRPELRPGADPRPHDGRDGEPEGEPDPHAGGEHRRFLQLRHGLPRRNPGDGGRGQLPAGAREPALRRRRREPLPGDTPAHRRLRPLLRRPALPQR